MHNTSAPGWPGIKPKWTSSSKSGIGKAPGYRITGSFYTKSRHHQ